MDLSAKNKILVLGRAAVDKEALVGAVIAAGASAAAPGLPAASSGGSSSSRVEWLIDTRYYQAPVEFWIDTTEELPREQALLMERWLDEPGRHGDAGDGGPEADIGAEMRELQAQLGEMVDAVVFVFDPLQPATFGDILPWAQFARRYRPAVLLCVARGARGCCADDALKDRLFGWCVAAGWEWVDLTDPDPESDHTVARVREALTSNEWATMRAKDHAAAPAPAPAPAAEAPHPSLPGPDVASAPDDPAARDEWDRFEAVAGDVDPARISSLHHALFADADAGDGRSADVSALLGRLRGARDEIAQLDDRQARARAAELALALARRL
ncbi:hypothetical protein H4R21_002766 [Coemansia helicoidea]|uniref:Uncharacterized protein n=1 Tax=Coemansia helicoidea TaxID=1286919 RepID=A0ACC1L649_9FUNG|nr:hypothetical protein H4R21_002766 [Coemansia helicoidea]